MNDIVSSRYSWTAARARFMGSHRAAIDDFWIDEDRWVSRITFFAMKFENPNILGADYYIYESGNGSDFRFSTLIASGQEIKMTPPLCMTEVPHNLFGDVYRCTILLNNPIFLKGKKRYMIAFRSVLGYPAGGKLSIFTTRNKLNRTRALWTFSLQYNGSLVPNFPGEDLLMDMFTFLWGWQPDENHDGEPDYIEQEWAFELE